MTASVLPNIHEMPPVQRTALWREKFSQPGRFNRMWQSDAAELDCHAHATLLRAEIMRLLIQKHIISPDVSLETLHKHIDPALKDYNYDDGVNGVTAALYDTDDHFIAEYHRFVKECLGHYFPYPFYFQAIPTLRVHCPDGYNAHHYPRYHTDVGYGHPPEEINVWVPLTEPVLPQYHGFRRMGLQDSRALLEKFDFNFFSFIDHAIHDKAFNRSLDALSPQVTTPLGKLLAFDARCIHTVEPLERHTRISMDIRIIPVEDFNALTVEYQGTGRRKVRYTPGHGYYSLSSDKL